MACFLVHMLVLLTKLVADMNLQSIQWLSIMQNIFHILGILSLKGLDFVYHGVD